MRERAWASSSFGRISLWDPDPGTLSFRGLHCEIQIQARYRLEDYTLRSQIQACSLLEDFILRSQIQARYLLEDFTVRSQIQACPLLEDYRVRSQIQACSVSEDFTVRSQIQALLEDFTLRSQIQALLEDYTSRFQIQARYLLEHSILRSQIQAHSLSEDFTVRSQILALLEDFTMRSQIQARSSIILGGERGGEIRAFSLECQLRAQTWIRDTLHKKYRKNCTKRMDPFVLRENKHVSPTTQKGGILLC